MVSKGEEKLCKKKHSNEQSQEEPKREEQQHHLGSARLQTVRRGREKSWSGAGGRGKERGGGVRDVKMESRVFKRGLTIITWQH